MSGARLEAIEGVTRHAIRGDSRQPRQDRVGTQAARKREAQAVELLVH
jgi:hypothetical protein